MVGYETGNAQILKNIKKGVGLDRARRFTRDCHEIGILIHGTFILGLPGETKDTIQESMRFAREMDCETIQVSLASPYPGTELFEYVTANGFLAVDPLLDERRLSEVHRHLSGPDQRRDLRLGRALLPQLLFPPALHL